MKMQQAATASNIQQAVPASNILLSGAEAASWGGKQKNRK